ncbi:MAG: thioesterase [Pseudonocardiaceae bacterium]|nr:thioesterase [Pseudonocardiaceae bacterium]
MTFWLRIAVRDDDLDALGHVNQAVYHRYGEQARFGLFRAAGCDFRDLVEQGVGVVLLESTMRYLAELRGGDELDVSCECGFGAGKTFAMRHDMRRIDGTLSGQMHCTMGLLDLEARRLLPEPRQRLLAVAADPALLDGAPAERGINR